MFPRFISLKRSLHNDEGASLSPLSLFLLYDRALGLQALGDHGTVTSSNSKTERRVLDADEIEEWLGLDNVEGMA